MKIKGFRWWIVALICLGTIINYLARNSLAVLAPQLQTKLNFTTQQYSYIVGAFQIGYTVMQSVCGFVLDFLGLRLGFSLIRNGLVCVQYIACLRRRLVGSRRFSRFAWFK